MSSIRSLISLLMMLGLSFSIKSVEALEPIRRWDALPALDVTHLQGAHQGTRVCPMCRHGYDAGVLVFVPSSIALSDLRALIDALWRDDGASAAPRFRRFLVFTGATPDAARLALAKRVHPRWYVARMSAAERDAASRALGMPLRDRRLGYVFAQRRMLWAFVGPLGAADESKLHSYSREALHVLGWQYPEAVTSEDPDLPRGGLWLAPNKLTSVVRFGADAQWGAICLVDARTADTHRLVGLALASDPGVRRWAVSDAHGCVSVRHHPSPSLSSLALHLEWMDATGNVRQRKMDLARGARISIAVGPATRAPVTRREPVVGGCDGCELAWVGMPSVIASVTRLSAPAERGEPLRVEGQVRGRDGRPRADIVIYAHQTDASGVYPPVHGDGRGPSTAHGRLRGWVRSDAQGRYRIDTIRPGSYPGQDIPQHIHL